MNGNTFYLQDEGNPVKKLHERPNQIIVNRKSNYTTHSQNGDPPSNKPAFTFQKNSSNEKVNPVLGKYAPRSKFAAKISSSKESIDKKSIHSSNERRQDSQDDTNTLDSGLGSSCEYKTKVSIYL